MDTSPVPENLGLTQHHWDLLHHGSGISEEVIRERGYLSVLPGDEWELQKLGFSLSQFTLPALLVPIHSVYKRDASYTIRMDDPGDRGKYQFVKNDRMILDVPPQVLENLMDPEEYLWVTEGAKKVDALVSHGVTAIGLAGVWNWRGKNDYGGTTISADWEKVAFFKRDSGGNYVPRRVIIVFDADVLTKTGPKDARNRLTAAMQGMGAEVWWVTLPTGDEGKVDDYLRNHSIEELAGLMEPAVPLPEINAKRDDLTAMAQECWANILADEVDPRVYNVADLLSWVIFSDEKAVKISPVKPITMQCLLSSVMKFYVTDKNGMKMYVPPPKQIAEAVIDRQDPKVAELRGVSTTPFFLPSGDLVETEGYDRPSQLYYDPPVGRNLKVPKNPTQTDVKLARELIVDVMLGDFPFDDDEGSSVANAVAVMVEQIVQPMIIGSTPLHIFSSPTPGTGKGFLAKCLLRPVLGKFPSMRPTPSADDEWRKTITAAMIEGERAFVIDNVTTAVDSGLLAAALTSGQFQDRLLGQNKTIEGRINWSWLLLANNPTVSFEISRRSVWTRMVPAEEKPWERADLGAFKIPDLMQWVEERADEVLRAALVLVQYWVKQGMPAGPRSLGSYEGWSRIVGGVLETGGIPGLIANQSRLNEMAVEEDDGWGEFTEIWWSTYGSQDKDSADLYGLAKPLVDLNGKDDDGRRKSLGRQLSQRADRVYGDLIIRRRPRRKWKLEDIRGKHIEVLPAPHERRTIT